MPIFSSIGLALGAGSAAAFGVGLGATALGVAAGVGGYMLGGGFDSKTSVDDRVAAATNTGALTTEEATSAAKKRAYRSGILFTSPQGITGEPTGVSAKLK